MNEVNELRRTVEDLQAENERLKKQLAVTTKDRDQYCHELFLAFPPPNYTDAEIADFINNRVPADVVLKELRELYGDEDK